MKRLHGCKIYGPNFERHPESEFLIRMWCCVLTSSYVVFQDLVRYYSRFALGILARLRMCVSNDYYILPTLIIQKHMLVVLDKSKERFKSLLAQVLRSRDSNPGQQFLIKLEFRLAPEFNLPGSLMNLNNTIYTLKIVCFRGIILNNRLPHSNGYPSLITPSNQTTFQCVRLFILYKSGYKHPKLNERV